MTRTTKVDDDEFLGPEDVRLHRGPAAALNYIASDRPDIAYAVEESATGMSAPRNSGDEKIGQHREVPDWEPPTCVEVCLARVAEQSDSIHRPRLGR